MPGLTKTSGLKQNLNFDIVGVKNSICWQAATLRLSLVVEHTQERSSNPSPSIAEMDFEGSASQACEFLHRLERKNDAYPESKMGGKEQTDRCWGREWCSFAFPSFASKYKLHPVKALHLKSLTSTTDRHKNLGEKKISKITTSEIIISHYICLRGKIFLYSFSYYMYFFNWIWFFT